MPLTDTAIRNAKSAERQYKLGDEKGLFLLIHPNGSKYWRLKYRYLGAEKVLALGVYPEVGLKLARDRRDEARAHLAAGRDPGAVKQAEKARAYALAADSFEVVARDWIERHLSTKAPSHRDKVIRRLERDVFPYLGRRPVSELKAPDILVVARRVEGRGALDTAHRVIQNVGEVIRYAIATGRAEADPTPALRGALPPAKHTHYAAPTDDPAAVGGILRMFDALTGQPQVIAAVRLLPLLVCRPGELRVMRWEDVDLDGSTWSYRVTKTSIDHIIPLSTQAVEILRDLHPLTGHLPGGWVFIGGRSPLKPLSEAAINAAMRRLGIDTKDELTGHGWRALLRTLGHERLGLKPEVIETHIAHKAPDPSRMGGAYARMRFIEERRKMMQEWSDYLDKLKAGADIIPIRGAA
ncbi:putative Phage integrase [Thiomonas sp. X19]|uniref:tyrosine-type recombinase/integrase n=1 Tax=Thiomonas sp. X19 TaxID=1050370 RepID=UPI000B757946|nr:integrase arm-type DNA-binding domain-containing protein [Thiomonas sp. X19]SCC95431.1 putative Phage integrase [Thiomonas sp. X19]